MIILKISNVVNLDKKISLLNETESFYFHFFRKLITLFPFSPAGKKRAYIPLYVFEKTRRFMKRNWVAFIIVISINLP